MARGSRDARDESQEFKQPLRRWADDLVLCEALLRVYDEGARRVHPAHYDADALVTAVVELDTAPLASAGSGGGGGSAGSSGGGSVGSGSAGSGVGKGFGGPGFYVQPGAHVSTRVPIALSPGDVIAHSFDLQHAGWQQSGPTASSYAWSRDPSASHQEALCAP